MKLIRCKFILSFALVCLVLVGCASPVSPPALAQQTPGTGALTASITPAQPRLPTRTPRPSPTPTLTQTAVPSPTIPFTPDLGLSKVQLIGLAWLENYNMLLSFQFPFTVDPAFYRVTLEDKDYACETITGYPDRLYCHGPGAKVLATVWVRVYAAGSTQPGFEKQVWIPYFNNNYDTLAR
jgi:hypothetical protein